MQAVRTGVTASFARTWLAGYGDPRSPPEPPYLRFISAGHYYAALIVLTPFVLVAELLLTTAFVHVALRLLDYRTEYDILVNLSGLAALSVGAVLVPWDWLWVAIGRANQVFLGISHLVIALWAMVIVVTGLNRLFRVPVWLGIVVSILSIPVGLTLKIMFMRSPL